MRWELTVGSGLTSAVLAGRPQSSPTLHVNAAYAVSPRISLGVAYGSATFSANPYTDENGVVTRQTECATHFGARLKGVILRRGASTLYGGIQLGVTTSDLTYEHDFPTALNVEDEVAYLIERPSPFIEAGPQVGAIGFIGASQRLFPHLEVYAELGNNLSLVSAGAAVVF